jgi:hypothetical protein
LSTTSSNIASGYAPAPNNANNSTSVPNSPAHNNYMNAYYTISVNVKKVHFNGSEASFYLWTTQNLGFSETCTCEQALLATISVSPFSAVLSETDPAEKELLVGRQASTTATVLKRIYLTDDKSVDQTYTSRSPELLSGCNRKP